MADSAIAKITTNEEFATICGQLTQLSESPETAKVADKNELKQKIEVYMRRSIVSLTSGKKKKDKKEEEDCKELTKQQRMEKLLEFLITLDKELPWKEFYSEHG